MMEQSNMDAEQGMGNEEKSVVGMIRITKYGDGSFGIASESEAEDGMGEEMGEEMKMAKGPAQLMMMLKEIVSESGKMSAQEAFDSAGMDEGGMMGKKPAMKGAM